MPEKLTKRVVEALKPQEGPYEVRDTEIKDFLVRVEPGGTRSFWFVYRLAGGRQGRRKRFRLGAYSNLSVEGARDLARAAAGDVARGIDIQAQKQAKRDQDKRERLSTLKAFLDGCYEPWAKANLKSGDIQLRRIRSDFEGYMERSLQSFNRFMIDGLRQSWMKAGMKPRSINRDIQRLRSVLSKAVECRVIDRHPLSGIKPLKVDKTGRVRFLSAAEEAALRKALVDRESGLRAARARFNTWRAARGHKLLPERSGDLLDHLRPLVILALNTGLRRGELLGLTWASVNLSAKLLTVAAATAKSGHTRVIPLNAEATDILKSWYVRQGKPAGNVPVFPGHDGGRLWSVSTSWESLTKRAGLRNFRLHDCRHHFASRLVQAGVDLYTVKELLGHSDITMTQRYSHLAPENLRQAVERMAG